MVMTYREWLEDRFPQHKLYGKEALGREYRRYVGITAGMDPVEYFHMSNDKGFSGWLSSVWSQLKDTKMKATNRNKEILWHIYKKRSTARLVKFMDENLVLREFYNPVRFNEATQIPTEPADEERLERAIEAYPQGLFTKSIQEHDPFGHRNMLDGDPQEYLADPITPQHYGGKDDPYEAIKVINAWGLGFCLGNVLKYIKRTGKKGDPVEDLKKAKRYLELEIEKYDIHG